MSSKISNAKTTNANTIIDKKEKKVKSTATMTPTVVPPTVVPPTVLTPTVVPPTTVTPTTVTPVTTSPNEITPNDVVTPPNTPETDMTLNSTVMSDDTTKTTVKKTGGKKRIVNTEDSASNSMDMMTDTDTSVNTLSESPVNFEQQIDEMLARKEDDRNRLKKDIQMLKLLKRNYMKQIRDSKKFRKNRNDNGVRRQPSGFAQSSRIRDELCDFLGMPHGSSIARTEVTKKVIEYIKSHDLEKHDYRRNIQPDSFLEKLVGTPKERKLTMEKRSLIKPKTVVTDELTYFNLQVHLSRHFISEVKVLATPVETSTSVSMSV